MKLYYSPGTCAIGIHILLEEIGDHYETHKVDVMAGEQLSPAYLAINPKGKVPALQFSDGWVLTEWPAIALYLAQAYPQKKLIPAETRAAARALETSIFINGTMHAQGFYRIFRPGSYSSHEPDQAAIKAQGLQIFADGFNAVAKTLGDQEYVFGEFSIADAALFYVAFWATRLKLPIHPIIQAHQQRMLARPAVQRVMHKEFP